MPLCTAKFFLFNLFNDSVEAKLTKMAKKKKGFQNQKKNNLTWRKTEKLESVK